MFPFISGFHQIAVLEPVSQQLQSSDNVELGIIVSYVLHWPGTVLVKMPPQHIVHDFMEPYEDGVWIQHGIDPVVDEEQELALLPDGTSIGVYRASIIPVLQQMH